MALVFTIGCEPDAASDAGPTAIDAGAETDAAPPVTPESARFALASTTNPGPFGLWGYLVARIDESRAFVLGGTDSATVVDSAWLVEVDATGMRASPIDAEGPSPRYCGCAAYDPVRGRVLVYGGRDFEADAARETWELDLEAGEWSSIPTANQPAGVIGCAMAFDPVTERTFLFGGANRGGALADLFRFDPVSGEWIQVDASGPVPRYDAEFIASRDGSLLLFGGSYGARGSAFYSDLWRLDPRALTWTEVALPAGPPGRRIPWVVEDPQRAGLYVGFGFDGETQPLGDFYYADLEALTWTELPLGADGPPGRGFARAIPGGPDALGAMFGGLSGAFVLNDAWRLVRD